MRKVAVVVLVIGAVVMAISACGRPAPTEPSVTTIQRASPPIPAPAPTQPPDETSASEQLVPDTRIVVAMLDNGGVGPFEYDPVDLTFNTGAIVDITLTSEAAFHTFTVLDLDINVEVNAEESGGIVYQFDQPGVYEIICVPHEALGMVGTITVQ